jgi:hypothetical protein
MVEANVKASDNPETNHKDRNMQTQFKINFSTDDIRSLLIEQARENDAIPANIDADSLVMRVSPRTGVTFVPADQNAATGSDEGSGDSE